MGSRVRLRDHVRLMRRLSSAAPKGMARPTRPALVGPSAATWDALRPESYNYLGKILNARVYEIVKETPLEKAELLSAEMGNTILLKREDVHSVHSFKIRGAYNKISQLPGDQLRRGVVACSAGNHAQGVALSAVSLGIDATIVMPTGTPAIKVNAVSKLLARGTPGSRVVLHGANYDEAQAEAKRIMHEKGSSLIHPFDDPLVIAGQGTIGMEICKQTTGKPLDAIFVCCGGGGMLAGIAAYVKRVRPSTMVIGVEAEEAAGMTESLRAGQPVTLDSVGLFVDGAAVRTVGKETYRVCSALVDDMVTVSNDEVRHPPLGGSGGTHDGTQGGGQGGRQGSRQGDRHRVRQSGRQSGRQGGTHSSGSAAGEERQGIAAAAARGRARPRGAKGRRPKRPCAAQERLRRPAAPALAGPSLRPPPLRPRALPPTRPSSCTRCRRRRRPAGVRGDQGRVQRHARDPGARRRAGRRRREEVHRADGLSRLHVRRHDLGLQHRL